MTLPVLATASTGDITVTATGTSASDGPWPRVLK